MTIGMTVPTGIGITIRATVRPTVRTAVPMVTRTGFPTLLASRAGVARAVHNHHHHDYDHHRDETPRDFCPPARLDPYRASDDPDSPAGPCRLCDDPSWTADDRGPVHRCCARAEASGLTRCGPCAVSREARRRWEANHPPVTGDDRAGGRR